MTPSVDYPHIQNDTNAAPPTDPTLTAIDTQERGMSVTHQQDQGSPPASERSRGERVAIASGIVVTVLATAGILWILFGRGQITEAPDSAPISSAAASNASPEPTAEDIAAREAQERYRSFIRVQDQVAQAGFDHPEKYASVAVSPEYGQLVLEARRFGKDRTVGDTVIASLTVQSVELPSDPAIYPKVRLRACLDVSAVTFLDAAGKSAAESNRPNRILSKILLQRLKAGTPGARAGGWFVSEVEQSGEPC